MLNLYTRVKALRATRDRGASAVEYGLMVAAIAAVIVTIVFLLGDVVQEVFSDTCTAIQTETPTDAVCTTP